MICYPDSIYYLCNVATVAQNMGFYLSLNPLKFSLIRETNTVQSRFSDTFGLRKNCH